MLKLLLLTTASLFVANTSQNNAEATRRLLSDGSNQRAKVFDSDPYSIPEPISNTANKQQSTQKVDIDTNDVIHSLWHLNEEDIIVELTNYADHGDPKCANVDWSEVRDGIAFIMDHKLEEANAIIDGMIAVRRTKEVKLESCELSLPTVIGDIETMQKSQMQKDQSSDQWLSINRQLIIKYELLLRKYKLFKARGNQFKNEIAEVEEEIELQSDIEAQLEASDGDLLDAHKLLARQYEKDLEDDDGSLPEEAFLSIPGKKAKLQQIIDKMIANRL